jgi:lipopolysaccharide/colanic/teichoic acid biosynthesis glycosyltransferase
MKRFLDLTISLFALVLTAPLLLFFMFMIWKEDFSSPFYIATRTGKNGVPFRMLKLRSMAVNADRSGVDSTSDNDARITSIGKIVRKYKIDELGQLINVFVGQMSMVGPRPNVERETDMYTQLESKLLTVKPGITDFASIVFADEGRILRDKSDPDVAYHQFIRPTKSALGLVYIQNQSFTVDICIILITLLSIASRKHALKVNCLLLRKIGCPNELVEIASRTKPLHASPPPGASTIVGSRP